MALPDGPLLTGLLSNPHSVFLSRDPISTDYYNWGCSQKPPEGKRRQPLGQDGSAGMWRGEGRRRTGDRPAAEVGRAEGSWSAHAGDGDRAQRAGDRTGSSSGAVGGSICGWAHTDGH